MYLVLEDVTRATTLRIGYQAFILLFCGLAAQKHTVVPMKTALVHHMKKTPRKNHNGRCPGKATDLAQSTSAFPPSLPATRPA